MIARTSPWEFIEPCSEGRSPTEVTCMFRLAPPMVWVGVTIINPAPPRLPLCDIRQRALRPATWLSGRLDPRCISLTELSLPLTLIGHGPALRTDPQRIQTIRSGQTLLPTQVTVTRTKVPTAESRGCSFKTRDNLRPAGLEPSSVTRDAPEPTLDTSWA
ncbi:hypothetical protein PHLGIDRAFT_471847 [Phlebiopsis gigantea 11061_1 CR5-6]|uniref:Uncharacterized protein n=1 Tax=Phlebiopsis gigantea (strain 11061_1 CR5-6) TaxID=745531 RepID=A0A0C3RWR0_PHLG1|nr:hypothetical protein PHLGIDRAFT_471847 [Phlebiopsis gigantea 11061_1 CR5-6]